MFHDHPVYGLTWGQVINLELLYGGNYAGNCPPLCVPDRLISLCAVVKRDRPHLGHTLKRNRYNRRQHWKGCLAQRGRGKWPPRSRRIFQIHFLEWKCWNLNWDFIDFFPQGPLNNNSALVEIMPIRRRAIIWVNDGPAYWRLYASLGLNELIVSLVYDMHRLSNTDSTITHTKKTNGFANLNKESLPLDKRSHLWSVFNMYTHIYSTLSPCLYPFVFWIYCMKTIYLHFVSFFNT